MLSDEQLTTIVAEASVGLHFGPTQAEFAERVRGACEAALEADQAERAKVRPSEDELKANAEACEMVWTARRTMGNGSRASRKHVSRVLARAVLEIADALDIKVDQDVHRIALGRRLEDEQPSGLVDALEPTCCGKEARS